MKNHKRGFCSHAILLLALCGAARSTFAGIVHIQIAKRGATEYGAGYTVGRGSDCFIVTPFHVVQFAAADAISVTDTKGSTAKARLLKGSEEFDAALLQVAVPHTLDCPADWSDGANAAAAVGNAQFLVARKVDDNGRVMQTRLFAASTTREQIELQPFGANDELREGDSGSALYAGAELVGLITSVDTKTKRAHALTQGQIHGLFGADVLPGAARVAVLKPLTVRKAENPYATAAAHDFLAGSQVQLVSLGADGKPPQGAQYVIAGTVVDVTSSRVANPDYKPPERAAKGDDNLGQQIFKTLQKRVNSEVNNALQRNTESQYLTVFNIDVQFEITKVLDNSRQVNLERRSYKFPELGATTADMEKTAVSTAVREALEATLKKYPL
ncbi:MAG TPA: hypothetical protein VHH11_10200 [Gammaproteobacteria bacterium]|jgi:hypothetical protein|nr:hypothetical protein [Gammaproteobacteria bacterium]